MIDDKEKEESSSGEEERIKNIENILCKVKRQKELFGSNPDLDNQIESLQNTLLEKKDKILLKG